MDDDEINRAIQASLLLASPEFAARVREMAGGTAPVPLPAPAPVVAPPAPVAAADGAPIAPPVSFPSSTPLPAELFDAFKGIMWGMDLEEGDVLRWFNQGFVFRCVHASLPSFSRAHRACPSLSPLLPAFSNVPGVEMGLRQRNGGPCGVLAPVQARVLMHLYFEKPVDMLSLPSPVLSTPLLSASSTGSVSGADGGEYALPVPSVAERRTALVYALSTIILQAGKRTPGTPPCAIVVQHAPADGTPCTHTSPAADFTLQSFTDLASVMAFVTANLPQFETPAGVMLLVMSAVFSRGVDQVKASPDCFPLCPLCFVS